MSEPVGGPVVDPGGIAGESGNALRQFVEMTWRAVSPVVRYVGFGGAALVALAVVAVVVALVVVMLRQRKAGEQFDPRPLIVPGTSDVLGEW